MKKLWVVYNPRSSHHAAIEAEVLTPARKVQGFLVGKYEIKQASVEENAKILAGMLGDGDLVVSAGGDGTATMAANAVMLSGKEVTFAALGYGNFNDLARMLGMRRPVEYGGEYVGGIEEIVEKFLSGSGESGSLGSGGRAGVGSVSRASVGPVGSVGEVFPLEVLVDGKHWRYAPCYATLGLLAEASEMMDGDRMRKSLNTGKRGPLYSLVMAVFWYLKNKGRRFLPSADVADIEEPSGIADSGGSADVPVSEVSVADVEVRLNGELLEEGTTDYLAVNGPTVSRLMKGGKWYLSAGGFGSGAKRLGKFWKMVGFGLRSVIFGLKLSETKGDVVEFSVPSTVEIQAEGEYQRLEGVSRIEVRKAERGMRVVFGGRKK